MNKQTVRFRPESPRLSPLLLAATWTGARPGPTGAACSDTAAGAAPAEWYWHLPSALCGGGRDTATSGRSRARRGNHTGVAHDPRLSRSGAEWPGDDELAGPGVGDP